MILIEFNGYNNTPILIAQSKIVGMKERDDETTILFISVGDTTEEWIVKERLGVVRAKFEYDDVT
jgi:hypothetical protein